MLDIMIQNASVLLPDGLQRVDLGITAGKVAAILADGREMVAHEYIDASHLLVFPGTIDAHFHCRAPSHPEREDFISGTTAAAIGGVTSVFEMPISIPPTSTRERLVERMEIAASQILVNMGFYGSCGTLDPSEVTGQIEAGAVGFKAFLQPVPPDRAEEFDGICLANDVEILRAFELLQGIEIPCAFHAEAADLYTYLTQRLTASGRRDAAAHPLSRPDYVEAIAIAKLLALSERFGVHVYVPHVSSGMSVGLIRDAKARGVTVWAETCPQYLAFTETAFDRVGVFAKCNPPLKTEADRAALWAAIADGTIDVVATDHSPFTVEEKDRSASDIWAVPPGFPGVEVLTQFIMGRAVTGELPYRRATELVASAPARIFGFADRKGQIRIGYDADLTIYDPSSTVTYRAADFRSRSGACAQIWEDTRVQGRVVTTIVGGKAIVRDGHVVGLPGDGCILKPTGHGHGLNDEIPPASASTAPRT